MKHTYAVSDLHGMLELYFKIKEFVQPEDEIYYLGDMGDRGTDCWETVKRILSDPQFHVLMGNHEDMLLDCMNSFIHTPNIDKDLFWYSSTGDLLYSNGGYKTLSGWLEESDTDKSKWYLKIKNLPIHLEYINKDGKHIHMSHAGYTPYDYFTFPDKEELIWDRSHFYKNIPNDAPKDIIVIHGHTPLEYLVDFLQFKDESYPMPEYPMAYWYANNRKCCIDNGAFYTKCTILLDLDTFEEHKFYTSDYNSEEIYS